MPAQQDLEAMRAKIAARPIDPNLKLEMPVKVTIAEASAVHTAINQHKAAFIAAAFDWKKIELFPALIGALTELQSYWDTTRFDSAEAALQWANKIEAAFDLKNGVLHAMQYAFRNKEDLIAKLVMINEGNSEADFVQDLNDITVLGREHEVELKAINFPMVQIESMADLAEEMRLLLAVKDGSLNQSETKILRDKALSWVKEIVSEIYACGQYLFWKDEKRKKLFRSEYLAAVYRRAYLRSKEEAVRAD